MRFRMVGWGLMILAAILTSGCDCEVADRDMAKLALGPPVALDIAIGPILRDYVDHAANGSDMITCATGKRAQTYFIGGEACPWQIELLTSHLSVETRDEFPFPIFHTRAYYQISCSLTGGGRHLPLSANSTGQSDGAYGRAVAEAVDRALRDLAAQAGAVISSR